MIPWILVSLGGILICLYFMLGVETEIIQIYYLYVLSVIPVVAKILEMLGADQLLISSYLEHHSFLKMHAATVDQMRKYYFSLLT